MKNTLKLPSELKTFDNYHDFESFCKKLFQLEPKEYKQLYEVMIKLESIGEDPIQNMNSWKNSFSDEECLDFIRFMILIDSTDILFEQAA